MHHVAPSESVQDRSSRALLKHPIRVTIAGERVVRVLSGDISPNGMFLMMADPPEAGTVVTLAFEAGGKVLPFAEGEVAWKRANARGGFGVRFTRYLHPRAKPLVDFLCENVEGGTLKPQAPITPAPRTGRWTALALIAAAAVVLITFSNLVPAPPIALQSGLACLPAAPAVKAPELALSTAQPVKARVPARLPEKPKATPTLARTFATASAVKPGLFTSTAIPSGAARLVNVSRVSGMLKVSIAAVAGGSVSHIATLQNPARLIIDVSGLPPIADHVLGLSDSELRKITVTRQGKGTRLSIELVRLPTRVVQQGDAALISF